MFFKQFYLGCLAHASYLIGSEGEACVVDPQRDVLEYIEEAGRNNLKIKYIFETHLHADFVSGHNELAELTGATIVYSDKANADFDHLAVKDGHEFSVGSLKLTVMATPGHTPESICLLIKDGASVDEPLKLLTGDTLFIGDVGRPDLVGKVGYQPGDMAGMLYDSLHDKILKLPDDTEIYPAHGAGSLCGKNISTDRSSTIGVQRRFNYALQPMSRDEFVKMLTAELAEIPAYFPRAVEANRSGADALSTLPRAASISADEVEKLSATADTIILDTRPAGEFGRGHIPGSYNIGLGGQFASWCGTIFGGDQKKIILVVGSAGDQVDNKVEVDEAVTRLARAGLDNVVAYLDGGIEAWIAAGKKVAEVPQISVGDLAKKLESSPELRVIDVRRPGEYESGHVPQAKNISLTDLEKRLEAVERGVKTAVICAGGYRSSMAISMLKRHGIDELINVSGGTSAWKDAGLPVKVEKKCSA